MLNNFIMVQVLPLKGQLMGWNHDFLHFVSFLSVLQIAIEIPHRPVQHIFFSINQVYMWHNIWQKFGFGPRVVRSRNLDKMLQK